MDINKLDSDYINLVKDIIYNKKFLKLQNCKHHGISRYEHSIKVSYNAYKFAKKYNLNFESVAIGGLLHDFFDDENYNLKQKFISYFNHPNKAVLNACNTFNVNELEQDIIKSHMFPASLKIPKYKESWLVSLFDKKVALNEFTCNFGYKMRYVCNLSLLLLFNFIK